MMSFECRISSIKVLSHSTFIIHHSTLIIRSVACAAEQYTLLFSGFAFLLALVIGGDETLPMTNLFF